MKDKKEIVSFSLTKELLKELANISRCEGLSKSSLAQRFIRKGIDEYKKEVTLRKSSNRL